MPDEKFRGDVTRTFPAYAKRGVDFDHDGNPDDVTGAVVFLLGQGAGFVTGQLLPVNGGFVFN